MSAASSPALARLTKRQRSDLRRRTFGTKLLTTFAVCAPDCSSAADCPTPSGSFDAMLTCASGQCMLDCTGTGFPFPTPLSCPSGFECQADGASLGTTSYCYH